ncbi:cytochrome c oxidase assembly protein [Sphingomonas sp. RS2018]
MIDWRHSYCGPAPSPATWATQWNADPVLLIALAVAVVSCLRLPGERRTAGFAAIGVLALAFVSPLCGLTTALFSARAVHHVLLVTVVAPLLAVALPMRKAPGAVAGLIVSTVALWMWHVPTLYDAALGHVGIYWAMQIALLGGGWAFWNAVRHAAPAEAAMALIGGAIQMGFLGALLTFAGRPLYASHLATTVPFGIGPLADQHYAGLIMWVPGMLPYAVALGWLAAWRWRAMTDVAA